MTAKIEVNFIEHPDSWKAEALPILHNEAKLRLWRELWQMVDELPEPAPITVWPMEYEHRHVVTLTGMNAIEHRYSVRYVINRTIKYAPLPIPDPLPYGPPPIRPAWQTGDEPMLGGDRRKTDGR